MTHPEGLWVLPLLCIMNDGFDRVATALSHQYRRRILTMLLDENPLSESDPEMVEAAATSPASGNNDLERAQIELYHTHLPKLDAIGYIDWNRDSGTIVKGSDWNEIEPIVRLFRRHATELPIQWP